MDYVSISYWSKDMRTIERHLQHCLNNSINGLTLMTSVSQNPKRIVSIFVNIAAFILFSAKAPAPVMNEFKSTSLTSDPIPAILE